MKTLKNRQLKGSIVIGSICGFQSHRARALLKSVDVKIICQSTENLNVGIFYEWFLWQDLESLYYASIHFMLHLGIDNFPFYRTSIPHAQTLCRMFYMNIDFSDQFFLRIFQEKFFLCWFYCTAWMDLIWSVESHCPRLSLTSLSNNSNNILMYYLMR